jgi:HTH-type transcriptional regulator, glycine betaine synthesis regulator
MTFENDAPQASAVPPVSESAPSPLTSAEALATEAVGRLIEFWGFRRNMGRVWAVLYLSPDPLAADQLRDALSLSSGAISMTLTDLQRWGVVRKVWIQGERRDYFAAEVQLWKMISRVLREREKSEISKAVEAFEEALRDLRAQSAESPQVAARLALQTERISQLLNLARLGHRLVDGLATTAKVDAEPLVRFLLRAER